MAKVLITGGSGLIGKAISRVLLKKGYEVSALSRDAKRQSKNDGVTYYDWNPEKQIIDPNAISGAHHIIHLAGAGIADKRWTKERKEELINSRVESGQLIVKALTEVPNNVRSVISASAIGWYGPDPVIPNPRPFVEDDRSSNDFLGETCRNWEQSLAPLHDLGKRLVTWRTGIVLSNDGGALKEFKRPLRFGMATILSGGKQVISWIHIDDLVSLYIRAIENETMKGVYNAVAPFPISNKEFTLQLARLMNNNFFVPLHIPSFALKVVLGEMSIEVLKSTTVSSAKVQLEGYDFLYPRIEEALKELFKK
jgi:uncharacterized protein (TIGR01777 family)